MPPKRSAMLASVVRDAVASVVLACPQSCGVISITDVIASEDCSSVTLYISALRNTDEAIAFVRDALPQMKAKMGGLNLRRMPELFVKADRRGERGERIEELLKR